MPDESGKDKKSWIDTILQYQYTYIVAAFIGLIILLLGRGTEYQGWGFGVPPMQGGPLQWVLIACSAPFLGMSLWLMLHPRHEPPTVQFPTIELYIENNPNRLGNTREAEWEDGKARFTINGSFRGKIPPPEYKVWLFYKWNDHYVPQHTINLAREDSRDWSIEYWQKQERGEDRTLQFFVVSPEMNALCGEIRKLCDASKDLVGVQASALPPALMRPVTSPMTYKVKEFPVATGMGSTQI